VDKISVISIITKGRPTNVKLNKEIWMRKSDFYLSSIGLYMCTVYLSTHKATITNAKLDETEDRVIWPRGRGELEAGLCRFYCRL
jgi:hypothetical protein